MPDHMRQRGKNGFWYADFYMNGVHYQDKLVDGSNMGTSDRRWAERFLAELKERIERREYGKFKKKVSETFQEYLNSISPNPTLYQRNEGIVRIHLGPFFGGKVAAEVTEGRIVEYKLMREAAGAKASTLKRELRCLKAAMLRVDPKFSLPSRENWEQMKFRNKGRRLNERDIPAEDKVREIVDKAVPEKYRVPCLVAAYTGLRLKDVCQLARRQIDLATGWIEVVQSKTRLPVRVPISRKLRDVLDRIKVWPIDPDGRLFSDVKESAVSTAVRRAFHRAGFSKSSFHTLRHFAATHLLNRGAPLKVVQEFMGHADIRSTLVYAHLRSDTLQRSALAAFDGPEDGPGICKSSANLETGKGG